MQRITFVVRGRVQGVGFRAHTAAAARRLGLAGYVQNRPDGSVAGVAQGAVAAVEQLVAWLQHGPPLAAVEQVEVQALPAGAELPPFHVVR